MASEIMARSWGVGSPWPPCGSTPAKAARISSKARLEWTVQGTTFVLLWPASLDTAVAETALQVQGPYAPLGLTLTRDGDQLKVEVPLQHAHAYYRLRLP